MTARSAAGFSLIEILISTAILGILVALLVPNLKAAFDSADNAAAKAYTRHVVQAIEIKYISEEYRLPDRQDCAVLSGVKIPTSVSSCVYQPNGSRTEYVVTVASVTGKTFRYDSAGLALIE